MDLVVVERAQEHGVGQVRAPAVAVPPRDVVDLADRGHGRAAVPRAHAVPRDDGDPLRRRERAARATDVERQPLGVHHDARHRAVAQGDRELGVREHGPAVGDGRRDGCRAGGRGGLDVSRRPAARPGRAVHREGRRLGVHAPVTGSRHRDDRRRGAGTARSSSSLLLESTYLVPRLGRHEQRHLGDGRTRRAVRELVSLVGAASGRASGLRPMTTWRRRHPAREGVLGQRGQGVGAGLQVGAVRVLAVAGRLESACEHLAGEGVEATLEERPLLRVGHAEEPRSPAGLALGLQVVGVDLGDQRSHRPGELTRVGPARELHDLGLRLRRGEGRRDLRAGSLERAREHVEMSRAHRARDDRVTYLRQSLERLGGGDLLRGLPPRGTGGARPVVDELALAARRRSRRTLRDEHGGAQRRHQAGEPVEQAEHTRTRRAAPGGRALVVMHRPCGERVHAGRQLVELAQDVGAGCEPPLVGRRADRAVGCALVALHAGGRPRGARTAPAARLRTRLEHVFDTSRNRTPQPGSGRACGRP